MKLRKTISGILLGLAVFFAPAALRAAAEKSAEPDIAPEFVLNNQDGKEVRLSAFTGQGKIVVLEWVNPECPFVKAHYEAETMKKLAEKYTKEKKIVWLAINSSFGTTAEQNRDFIREYELPYAILLDPDGKVGRAYKATNTPQMFIIDARGKIVYRGAIDNAPMGKTRGSEMYVNYVEKALDELLAGKAVAVPRTRPYGCTVKYADLGRDESQRETRPKPRRDYQGPWLRPHYY